MPEKMVPQPNDAQYCNLALIGQAVLEKMLEDNGHIDVDCPETLCVQLF